MPKTFLTVVVSLALGAALPANALAQPPDTVQSLSAAAVKAYQAKDYAQFLTLEKKALELDPQNPRVVYNVACGEALNGHGEEAVRRLDTLLARKLDLGAEADDDFAKIRATDAWAGYLARLAALRKPQVRSAVAYRIDDAGVMAAGLDVDTRTGDVYVASIRERKILRITKAGVATDFTKEAQDGFLAGAAVAVDAARHLLYASTSTAPFMKGAKPEEAGRGAVFAFDLKTGRTVRQAWFTPDGKQHFLNQLALGRDGTLYLADSGTPGIYRLKPGADRLELFVGAEVFHATQGIALSDDGQTMYVADYTDGLWAMSMATKQRRRLTPPGEVWLGGLDGLTKVAGGLLAVQIGVQPQRVVRIRLDAQSQQIAGVDILEMNHPAYAGPIQGALTGDGGYLYVANSQLTLVSEAGFALEKAKPTVILRLPL